ncbi:MAG: HAD-IA family hydrolase [Lachnospiraceae bacterium]|nr:HAD-IA family hydrolase [Lachnospiraceae bacterium]
MIFDLLIFDFDGTLADTQKTIVEAKKEAARQLGLHVASEEEYIATIGLSSQGGFRKVYPDLPEERMEHCVTVYRRIFDAMKEKIPPVLFPGTEEVLKTLKAQGKTLTIASARNKESLDAFLEGWGVRDLFAYVLSGDDTTRLKPHPEAVLKTMKDLSFSPEETLVIGDMPLDIAMGKDAGAYTCGVTYGNSNREDLTRAGATYVVDAISELLDLEMD